MKVIVYWKGITPSVPETFSCAAARIENDHLVLVRLHDPNDAPTGFNRCIPTSQYRYYDVTP